MRRPCLTIRKFPAKRLGIDDLVAMGALTPMLAEFLRASVVSGRNILISGGTGTGKTTLLNCLSDFIPSKERVVTIEDTAELQLQNEHVVRLETKSANVEGAGEYTIRDLVRNALRMRPDRIVVGECRGKEALDMDQRQVASWLRWWGLSMFATFFILAVALAMPPVAVGATLLVFMAPRYLLDQLIRRRQIRLRDQLVRASSGVANGCRAGLSLAQSLEKVAEDTPEPMSREFRRVVRNFKAGRPLGEALREVEQRLKLESFTLFASAVNVALERGGRVTFALDRISAGLLESQRLERKLEADSAAGRKLALVLSVFPIGFLAMFSLLDPHSTGYLYSTPEGHFILLGIGVLVFLAARWCMAILRIDF